jgi:anti-sigma B factor antagonist
MLLDIEVAGNVGVIHVHGAVDAVEGPRLSDAAEKLLHEGARSLVIDCRDVGFMDSSGLRALLKAYQLTVSRGGTMTLQRPSRFIYDLVQMVGLEHVMVIDGAPDGDRGPSLGGSRGSGPHDHDPHVLG